MSFESAIKMWKFSLNHDSTTCDRRRAPMIMRLMQFFWVIRRDVIGRNQRNFPSWLCAPRNDRNSLILVQNRTSNRIRQKLKSFFRLQIMALKTVIIYLFLIAFDLFEHGYSQWWVWAPTKLMWCQNMYVCVCAHVLVTVLQVPA